MNYLHNYIFFINHIFLHNFSFEVLSFFLDSKIEKSVKFEFEIDSSIDEIDVILYRIHSIWP
jgi:hypothetical protein